MFHYLLMDKRSKKMKINNIFGVFVACLLLILAPSISAMRFNTIVETNKLQQPTNIQSTHIIQNIIRLIKNIISLINFIIDWHWMDIEFRG